MSEQTLAILLGYTIQQLPVLIAWLIGIILCVVHRRRYPRASLLTSVALVLLAVESLMAWFWRSSLPTALRAGRSETGIVLAQTAFFLSSLRVFSWCLILAAIFDSRQGTTMPPAAGVAHAKARPWSITLLGWALIALAIAGLIPFTFVPAAVQEPSLVGRVLFAGAFACLIQLSMGLGMLEGKNWARLLFLWVVPASLLVGALGLGLGLGFRPSHVVRGAGYLAAVAILRQRSSQEWFQRQTV